MASPFNIVGAAVGLHVLALSLLGVLEPPPVARPTLPLELSVIATKAPAPPPPVPVAAPAPPAPAPARPRAPARHRAPARVAAVAAPTPQPIAAASARAPAPEPAPAPARPAPDSDEAVLLGAIGQAGRNDAALDGNQEGSVEAGRALDFMRGVARGALAPPHESKAAPAEPTEDYTRLVPRYTDAAIDHDVSASVAMRVEVDEHGRVVDARVLKGAGYGLDAVALETVKKYHFKPARDDEGRPVRSTFGWRIVWTSYWRRLMLYDLYGHPNCRGQGPLNLGSIHPVYIDCDGDAGYFELEEESKN